MTLGQSAREKANISQRATSFAFAYPVVACTEANGISALQEPSCKDELLYRMGWVTRWTPTASSDEEPGRLMVVNFFSAATTPLPRHIGETGL